MKNRQLALVTGASNGIGYQIASQLAGRGYDLVATGRSARIAAAAEEFRGLGAEVIAVRADLTQPSEIESVWAAVVETHRPLEVAVINAGIGVGGAPFWKTDLEQELAMIELNVRSVVQLAKPVVVAMQSRGAGRILFTSSISATQPTPYETVYGPTRAFVYSFSESLREELREHGVTVTALLPGATDSDFHARAGMGATAIGRMQKNDRVAVARQGIQAMLEGRDHVVGGDLATKWAGFMNRFLSETYKARKQGREAKP
ncbi:MAG: SDR family NAD(P)-dependent oxidoreductase [Beutenbergiaceae bacterium]